MFHTIFPLRCLPPVEVAPSPRRTPDFGHRTSDSAWSRSGSALVIVLGMLSVLLLMGVAFSVTMRTERAAAANMRHAAVARHILDSALARTMADLDRALEEQGDPVMLDVPCGVKLSHVSYRYSDDERLVLDDLSFDFKPGSTTAIMGETGAGKTTIIRIILALLKPSQGTVTIYDSHESMELTPRRRCNIVYVPQGNTLLSGTIRDNLRLGRLGATEEEMANALHMACADFVFDLPEGLDTECSESGGGLSEGQAQRISIARALLRDRSIMLFDEATSALDPETERQLLHNILGRHDRTILFITHRPAVVEYCDQTLHLEKIHKMEG